MLSAGAGARRRAEMDSTSVAAVAAVHKLLFDMQRPVFRHGILWLLSLACLEQNPHAASRRSNCRIALRQALQANEGVVQRGQDHFAISHRTCMFCQSATRSIAVSDRCNRQRASLLQALARPRFVASDDCNAAPSGPLSKWEATALQALQPPVGVRGSERTDAIDETPQRR